MSHTARATCKPFSLLNIINKAVQRKRPGDHVHVRKVIGLQVFLCIKSLVKRICTLGVPFKNIMAVEKYS